MILARIYAESDETLDALEHAVLGGFTATRLESAPKVKVWPELLADMVTSKAPWVCQNALLALEYVGDLAPPELARSLVTELLRQLREDTADVQIAPTLLKALSTLILEATDEDISKLIPILERAAVRQREEYLLTDPGVMTLAARLYRFRPNFRQQAASIFEKWPSGRTLEIGRAPSKNVVTKGELIAAIEQVAERDSIDVTRTLSDLGHMTPGTRELWSQRLQFVTDHSLGKRSQYQISPRYDVPAELLQRAGCGSRPQLRRQVG